MDQTDSRHIVIRTYREQRTALIQVEFGEASPPGKHDFVPETEVHRKLIADFPIVLNVGGGYRPDGVLGPAAEVAQTANAAGGGLGQPEQIIPERISREIPAKTERSILAVGGVVADHNPAQF